MINIEILLVLEFFIIPDLFYNYNRLTGTARI